jgi:hypothetical protein
VYLCVLCGSENKQRFFPYTALTDWFIVAFTKLRKAATRFVMSVRLSVWNNSALSGQIFMKFDIWMFFENRSRKSSCSKSDKNNRCFTRWPIHALHDDQHTLYTMTNIHFTRWPIYTLHDDQYTLYTMTNIHFTRWPIYTLHDDQYTLYTMTNIHFRSYLANFFLEWEMVQTKFV